MADDRFPQQQPVPSGEHLYIIPKTRKHYEFPTLIVSLYDNYINNFIYICNDFLNDFTMSEKMGHFQILFFNDVFMVEFMILLWLNLWFSFTWFRRKESRTTQKINDKKH